MIDGNRPRRRNSLRYPGFDYTQPVCVFVTLCTHHRQRLFGHISDAEMVSSPAGVHAADLWHRLSDRFPSMIVDTFVMMPDHLHSIVFLGANPEARSNAPSLSDLVKWYKVTVQSAYSANVRAGAWTPYRSHLWQRGYHDRIIRSDHELDDIRRYIEANPARWQARQDGDSWP